MRTDQASEYDPMHTRHIRFEPDELREIAYLGVRRASAFMSIGLQTTEEFIPNSLSVERHSMLRFMPETISEADAKVAVQEYRSWIIGNSLRELDLNFNIFLDRAYHLIQLSKLHGTRLKVELRLPNVAGQTNVGEKYKAVMSEIGGSEPNDASMLRSLSNARNCLAHNNGIVTERYAHTNGNLEMMWIGIEGRIPDRDPPIIFPPVISDPIEVAKGERIEMAVVVRRKCFVIGSKVELTPHELQEICFLYIRLTDKVVDNFLKDLRARGIPSDPPNSQRPGA